MSRDFAEAVLRGQDLADHNEWPRDWVGEAQAILACPWHDLDPGVRGHVARTGTDRIEVHSGDIISGRL